MTAKPFYHHLEAYGKLRAKHREETRAEFYAYHENAGQMIAVLSELVAESVMFLEGKPIDGIEQGEYIIKLIISYCRSFFISLDLLADGDLIESAIVVRKQFEVLGRLHELTKGEELSKLNNKTPNLKHLFDNLKKQYSAYSKVAHSSSLEGLALLGVVYEESGAYTPLYPIFQEDSYISLKHIVMCAAEFFIWRHSFYKKYFPTYDNKRHNQQFEIFSALFKQVFGS